MSDSIYAVAVSTQPVLWMIHCEDCDMEFGEPSGDDAYLETVESEHGAFHSSNQFLPTPLSEAGIVGVEASSHLKVVPPVFFDHDSGRPLPKLFVLHAVACCALPDVEELQDKGAEGVLTASCSEPNWDEEIGISSCRSFLH